MDKYHWYNPETGEIRTTIWHVLIGDIRDLVWCIKNHHKMWPHRWRYSRKGY